jgi:predicted acylesterase/phospholipase RssA
MLNTNANARGLSRRRFLGTVAAAGGAAALSTSQLGAQTTQRYARLSHGLILSGGGARGAYEAGIIGALAASRNIRDGQPLDPYGFVSGTSIGALNGWLVATGQYSRLRALWSTIASADILQIKPEYAAIRDPNSGVFTRLMQGMDLLKGLRTNVSAIMRTEPVVEFIQANIDPDTPVLMPFVWAATNLTMQQTEYFYRVPHAVSEERQQVLLEIFRRTIGPSAVLREASDEYLQRMLFASAALPIVFDPVELPAPNGDGTNQYVDGGVACNTPIALTRTVAQNVHVVLLDAPFEQEPCDNALEIAFAIWGTMQRKIMEHEIKSALLEASIRQTFDTSGMTQAQIAGLDAYFADSADTQFGYIRPQKQLALRAGSFNDDAHIREAMDLGWTDAGLGFQQYDLADFLYG